MKMIVSDLDGTLFRSDRSISPRTLATLSELAVRNIRFIIATARAQRHLGRLLPFDFSNMYAVCYNGAEIYHGNQLIFCDYITENTAQAIVTWLQKQYQGINLALEVSNNFYTNFDINAMVGLMPPFTLVDFSVFDFPPVAKILVDLRGVSDTTTITDILPDNCVMVITDGGMLGQITHKTVSKFNAINYLAKSFEFGSEDAIAFGDDYNDLEMIRQCGIGVAMGNAPPKVKEAADIVTGTNDEDGVAMILERVIKGIL